MIKTVYISLLVVSSALTVKGASGISSGGGGGSISFPPGSGGSSGGGGATTNQLNTKLDITNGTAINLNVKNTDTTASASLGDRQLLATDDDVSVDWKFRNLQTGNIIRVNWNTNSLTDSSEVEALNWGSRTLWGLWSGNGGGITNIGTNNNPAINANIERKANTNAPVIQNARLNGMTTITNGGIAGDGLASLTFTNGGAVNLLNATNWGTTILLGPEWVNGNLFVTNGIFYVNSIQMPGAITITNSGNVGIRVYGTAAPTAKYGELSANGFEVADNSGVLGIRYAGGSTVDNHTFIVRKRVAASEFFGTNDLILGTNIQTMAQAAGQFTNGSTFIGTISNAAYVGTMTANAPTFLPLRAGLTLINSNLAIGTPFTNNYGSPCTLDITANLVVASIGGISRLEVQGSFGITNVGSFGTFVGLTAGNIPVGVSSTIVPVGGIVNFVDTSVSAGNSATVKTGSGQITY